MTAEVVMHGEWEDNYDDPSHPIPALNAVDIQTVKIGGGSDLVIIVASPLRSDERSLRRLLSKIENYLGFLSSPECQAKAGVATPENTSIVVRIHPDSDEAAFELIERCKPWAIDNNVLLKMERL
jgi:hypothetical protein